MEAEGSKRLNSGGRILRLHELNFGVNVAVTGRSLIITGGFSASAIIFQDKKSGSFLNGLRWAGYESACGWAV